jgi:4-oxalocrotonate tautomerase
VPYINVKLIEGVFTPDQKAEIAERVTDVFVDIEGEHVRPLTLCVLEEVKSGDWAVGGQPLTLEAVHAARNGQRSPA